MEITVKTITRKITPNMLKQIDEAKIKDLRFALENGKVLGYVNPVNTKDNRIYLILCETGDLRKVTNYMWQDSPTNPLFLVGVHKNGNKVSKQFISLEAKAAFTELFRQVKTIAECTHLYI